MITRWFKETDTAYLELAPGEVVETRPLSDDVLVDIGADGEVIALTIEHASTRMDLPSVVVEEVDRGAA